MTRVSLLLMIGALLLSGCETVEKIAVKPARERAAVARADSLEAKGEYVAAARVYQELARSAQPPDQRDYLLSAAALLVQGKRIKEAKEILETVVPREGRAGLAVRLMLIHARIDLVEGRAQQALRRLSRISPAQVSREYRPALHRIRAQAYTALGNHVEGARERVQLEPFLDDPDVARENQKEIWKALAVLSEEALQKLRPVAVQDTLRGWMELALIAKRTRFEPQDFRQQLAKWRAGHPNHPADETLIESLMDITKIKMLQPRHIAVLLPLEGRFAEAARAVRDGFLAAYYANRETGASWPVIRIYDTHARNIWAVYQTAVKRGADLIVGPLNKRSVTTLAGGGELDVPTLALNYGTQAKGAPKNLFQFGLSPEDEARQVAEHAWLMGYTRALALYPQGDWGERVYEAFRSRWEQLGGSVLESQRYQTQAGDFATPVRMLLNVDESHSRYRALRTYLKRDIEFESRHRIDAEFVFTAAFPVEARQIRPQLKFFGASALPLYATSHVFTGKPDADRDGDMDGIVFGDMPWALTADSRQQAVREAVHRYWPERSGNYKRLFALGVDAYNIIPHLERLRAYRFERFHGETGSLRIDEADRVRRQLIWARFDNGIPRVIEESIATGGAGTRHELGPQGGSGRRDAVNNDGLGAP